MVTIKKCEMMGCSREVYQGISIAPGTWINLCYQCFININEERKKDDKYVGEK